MDKQVILKKGRESSLLRRHPWIFEGAIARIYGKPRLGETVEVRSHDEICLGYASFSPHSQIRARVWCFEPQVSIDQDFFLHRLQTAIRVRQPFADNPKQTAYRLVAAESDELPGIIVDRYGETLVCQFLTAGAAHWKDTIIQCLAQLFPTDSIYERSDADVRQKEGLTLSTGLLHGKEPAPLIEIQEGDVKILVDIRLGHKTGFYLDQRANRDFVGKVASDKQVLNCFSYTGGFSLAALQHGAAHVTNIDASANAVALSEQNHHLNKFAPNTFSHLQGDVFKCLRQFKEENRSFDLIVLDPPKFVENRASIERAARGYKDINRLAFHLLNEGGILATFSCSGLLEANLFQKIVADAALDAHASAHIQHRLAQDKDHVTHLTFPEGFYLKGLICQKTGSW